MFEINELNDLEDNEPAGFVICASYLSATGTFLILLPIKRLQEIVIYVVLEAVDA